jgi:hypothetical protein
VIHLSRGGCPPSTASCSARLPTRPPLLRLRMPNGPRTSLASSVPRTPSRERAVAAALKARADRPHDYPSRRSNRAHGFGDVPKRSSTSPHAPSPAPRGGAARRGSQNARRRIHAVKTACRGAVQRNCGLDSPFFGVLGCSPPVRSPMLSASVLACSPPVRSQNPIAQDSTFRQGKSRCDATPFG